MIFEENQYVKMSIRKSENKIVLINLGKLNTQLERMLFILQ
jgi:hypothetical protein